LDDPSGWIKNKKIAEESYLSIINISLIKTILIRYSVIQEHYKQFYAQIYLFLNYIIKHIFEKKFYLIFKN